MGSYPFCKKLVCDKTTLPQHEAGSVEVSASAFHSVARIYNPFRLVSQLNGPTWVKLSNECGMLKISTRMEQLLPKRALAEARQLMIASDRTHSPLLEADDMQGQCG